MNNIQRLLSDSYDYACSLPITEWPFLTVQPARKVMPDSWELVNFAIAHVNSVLNLLTDDWVFF